MSQTTIDINRYIEYVHRGMSKVYTKPIIAALGLSGEVGEVCNVMKKMEALINNCDHYKDTVSTEDLNMQIVDELGDVLWQYIALVESLGLDFYDVVSFNIDKLQKRYGDEY